MRKAFLEDLPRKEGIGALKGKQVIDWKNSVGCIIDFIYNDIEGQVEILDYLNNGKLLIGYIDNKMEISPSHFSKCQLGKLLGKVTGEFKIEIGVNLKSNTRDLLILNREYRVKRKGNYEENQKWYKCKCNKCNYENWVYEGNLLKGCGCPACCNPPKVAVLNINTIWDTNPEWIAIYGVSVEDAKTHTVGSDDKIKIICPHCSKEKMIRVADINRYNTIGCRCGDGYSKGHKYIYELLIQLNIDFIDNYSPNWCKFYNEYKSKNSYGEYDFIIESMKLIVEVDGGFHRIDNKMNGQSKEESKYLDNVKDKLAEENGYKVIRIPYGIGEFKDSILNSELSHIFDLSSIDWKECEEKSIKNIIKEVCVYWSQKEEWETTKDLERIFGINYGVVRNYLKKGSKIWDWCNYDTEEEEKKRKEKASTMAILKCSKKVEIFKDNISMGVFCSAVELSKLSEEYFGVNLDQRNIRAVARGEKKTHHGYTFKYVQ